MRGPQGAAIVNLWQMDRGKSVTWTMEQLRAYLQRRAANPRSNAGGGGGGESGGAAAPADLAFAALWMHMKQVRVQVLLLLLVAVGSW